MFVLTCSGCQKTLSVKEAPAGRKVKCPACGTVVTTAEPAPKKPSWDLPSNPFLTDAGAEGDADDEKSILDMLAPAQSADEIGRLGKYRLLEVLGRGAMGVVFKAEDPKLKRTVAIKTLLPTRAANATSSKRFLREAEVLAAIEHDHIVRIYDVNDGAILYFAMELLKGEPLDQRLARDAMLPMDEVLRIGREIASGLSAAHKKGLVHRDIKPGNLWLEAETNRVKIVDFGLARPVEGGSELTAQGAVLGTAWYMSPEQARAETVDGCTDLWSLGAVLYQLSTGRCPFEGVDEVSVLTAAALHDPTPPCLVNRDVPAPLSDLILELLQKDAARRIASADLVIARIRAIETGTVEPVPAASAASPPEPPPTPASRSSSPLVLLLLAALGAIGLLLAGVALLVYFLTR